MLTEKELKRAAKKLLASPTYYETLFKTKLNLCNINFSTQIIIGFYIVDFVIPERMLVIEIDGEYHYEESQVEYDKKRDNFLKSLGFHVLRIANSEVEDFGMSKLEDYSLVDSSSFDEALIKSQEVYSKVSVKDKKQEIDTIKLEPVYKNKTEQKKPIKSAKPRLVKKGTAPNKQKPNEIKVDVPGFDFSHHNSNKYPPKSKEVMRGGKKKRKRSIRDKRKKIKKMILRKIANGEPI